MNIVRQQQVYDAHFQDSTVAVSITAQAAGRCSVEHRMRLYGELGRHCGRSWSRRGFASIPSAAPSVLDPATQIIMCWQRLTMWPNNWVQATPGCALLLTHAQRPGMPEQFLQSFIRWKTIEHVVTISTL
jgi:hypothetical protein